MEMAMATAVVDYWTRGTGGGRSERGKRVIEKDWRGNRKVGSGFEKRGSKRIERSSARGLHGLWRVSAGRRSPRFVEPYG